FHGVDRAPSGRRARAGWQKAVGATARDLMSGPVVTVGPNVSVTEAAGRLARSGLRRLFVVDGDRLVGVLARRDILRGFLRGDPDIQRDIEREFRDYRLTVDPARVRVTVQDGMVWLTGRLEWQGDVVLADRLAKGVPGVVGVRNRLDYFWIGVGPRADALA
ncbi:MAG TPA: CBS domain-containing protein, partial [Pseudonocardiaceae bacterium]